MLYIFELIAHDVMRALAVNLFQSHFLQTLKAC